MTNATIDRRQFIQRLSLATSVAIAGNGLQAIAGDKQGASFAGVLDLLDNEFKAKTFPGAAVVVTQHRKPVLEKFWGSYRNRERHDVPCDGQMVNMLYSVSKLIASTVIVTAHQDGLFDYDAPVSKYIPEFTGGGKDKIIVRHLLTHSAGIPNVLLRAVDTEKKWQTAVKTLCAAKVEWEPGSKTLYHGITGHFLAAEVVRRCSNMKTWEEICQERLIQPLGAKSLTFTMPAKSVPVSFTPQSTAAPFQPGFFEQAIAGHPAGSAFATCDDLLKVLHLHLNKGVWQGRTLIKPDAFKEMHTVQYAGEIDKAIKVGKTPIHETWGLGILLRGPGPATGSHQWFGMGEVKTPSTFGHAGISTIIGVADPALDAALVFLTTDLPKPQTKAGSLRSGVVAKAFAKLG